MTSAYTYRPKLCADCGIDCIRHEVYDAYFCPICEEWREAVCSDPECEFCAARPEKPNEDEYE